MERDPLIGRELAGYRIEEQIGRGGMGVVYRAEHLLLGRKDALKLLASDLSEDEAFRERFLRESRIAAGMDHPNVIPIHHAGEVDGLLYISMRYVQGSDLRTVLTRSGRLDAEQTVSIVDQVASALDAAHARGLVHRDVKPANILIAANGQVYLTDFGIAKHTRTRGGLTKTGSFLGTLDYAAPEQIEGKQLDGRADVYALGCVVYQCLTGALPYEKDSEVQMIYAHLLEPAPPPSTRHPGLPRGVDAVIDRALAKSRDDRYRSCGELAAALRAELTGGRTVPRAAARPTAPPPTRVAAGAHAARERPRPALPRLGALRGRSLLLAGIGALVVVVGGVIVAVVVLAGGSSNAFPNKAEQHLLSLVPRTIRTSCVRLTPPAGATAALSCTPSRTRAAYYQFTSRSPMKRYYARQLPSGYVRGVGNCAGLPLIGERPYSGRRTTGRIFCTSSAAGGASIGWTDEEAGIYAHASRTGGGPLALYRWWSSAAGPLASPKGRPPRKSAPAPPGVILFQDTFATHASGWPQVTGATGKLAYSGGSYHVLVARGNKTAHPSTAQLSRPVSFGNAAIQAGITKVAGAGTYSFGVFCRSSAPETFYRFEVRNDGVLVIARQAGARLNVLAHSPAPASGLVRKTNSVSAVCAGGAGGPARLRLVLNGKTLTAVDKRPLAASGAVGMLASTGKNGRVEVAFDRFTVRVR